MSRLVISAAVAPGPAHDRISVWVRGQHVGTLTVGAGDGEAVASRLVRLGLEQGERIEAESGSVHFSEPADSETLCPACGAIPGGCYCPEWTPEERGEGRIFHRLSGKGPILCPECGCVCVCECGHIRERVQR